MTRTRHFISGMALAAVAVTAAAASIGASLANSNGDELSCDIIASTSAKTTRLIGVVKSGETQSGIYRFKITSVGASGSSSLSQGGAFKVRGGGETELGNVMLASPGSSIDAHLEIQSNGQTAECDKRFGTI